MCEKCVCERFGCKKYVLLSKCAHVLYSWVCVYVCLCVSVHGFMCVCLPVCERV